MRKRPLILCNFSCVRRYQQNIYCARKSLFMTMWTRSLFSSHHGSRTALAAVAAAAGTATTGCCFTILSGTTTSSSSSSSSSSPSWCHPSPNTVRNLRKRITTHKATDTDITTNANGTPRRRYNTDKEIAKLRFHKENGMLQRWERDEEESAWRKLPSRAWPAYQPDPETYQTIAQEARHLHCHDDDDDDTTSTTEEEQCCHKLRFQMATTLVFYSVDPIKGLQEFEALARLGHVDAMVGAGITLVEGLGGVPPHETRGIQYLETARAAGSNQACYELGVLYYTGLDGTLEEDETHAYQLFAEAAAAKHTAAMYMCADCLAEGVPRNVAAAIPLYCQAAEQGHRFARQRIRELLNRQEYQQQQQQQEEEERIVKEA